MNKWLGMLLMLVSNGCFADNLHDALNSIESEWAVVHYSLPKAKQQIAYPALLAKIQPLMEQYPNDAGVIYWQALVKASYANYQNPVAALQAVHEVRDLLTKAIAINPRVMNGAAYIVLGTLYDKVPGWPIGFGDDNTAKSLLETALKINPNGIVSNYFYGQFLLTHDDEQAAERYFNKALAAPIRAEQIYADSQMRHNVERELKKLHPLSQRSH
ncbi:MAG: TRAP transporter TatT component family protein [Methylococcales bacterium]|nr:TRAP transporter TatT component family protein [Methylococcales bacterium]